MDRHARRSRLRVELPAPGPGRGLRKLGRAGEVRPGLRGGVEQGDEPRSIRRPLVLAQWGRGPALVEARRPRWRSRGRARTWREPSRRWLADVLAPRLTA